MVKLAAIYNTWDADYLLPYSINSIHHNVDVIIVVYQNQSNTGELYQPEIPSDLIDVAIHFQPDLSASASLNETNKRNIGIEKAREMGCTHFILMDNDECYDSNEFRYWKEKALDYDGSACRLHTYYHSPDIRLSPPENYYVPFIHKLYAHTRAGVVNYPVYADPTRRISTHENFLIIEDHLMHHYSWVRRDIAQKLRNSSASKAFENRIDDLINGFNAFKNTGKMVFFDAHNWVKTANKFEIEL